MTPADVINEIAQVLSSPAWYGTWTAIGVTFSTTISIIALRNSRQPRNIPSQSGILKKLAKSESPTQILANEPPLPQVAFHESSVGFLKKSLYSHSHDASANTSLQLPIPWCTGSHP